MAVSDDEDDVPLSSRVTRASRNGEDKANQRKRKKVRLDEEEEEEEEAIYEDESRHKRRKRRKVHENEENEEEEEEEERGRGKRIKKLKKVEEEEEEPEPVAKEEEEEQLEDAKPIGEVIRVTGKGKGRRNHYESFEYDGNRYELVSFHLFVSFNQKMLLNNYRKLN